MHRLILLPQFNATRTCCLRVGVLALFLVFLTATGCGSSDTRPAAMSGTGSDAICDRQWLLENLSIDGREHKPRMFWQKMWRDRPYLGCDKFGFVRGSAGSNPYLGKFRLSDSGAIKWLKPPKISRMVGRRDSSELEQDFLLALPRVTHARTSGDILILEGDDGTRLEFKQTGEVPPPAT
ncbi:META domain-containing protein [Microbulbifer hydrolyticus]|uniref:Heat shock protein HslJ n=1 Tax=Microbulbifer hydrolyticus TaxID=48074 RepID=A0A6P1T711_9GAMM|nr:META domain-containing protein [Microbulbifer hydrolyticus]MBB5211440.1 heat shock protein HslJ [Microbulbifer hydrolyticus]QHQ37807.1 META domain-containing protein [Microbulbifer hydrolyticus]